MRVLTKDGKPILVDGKMICVDEVTQISDVTVNGESVVNADGVVEIPVASASGNMGLVAVASTNPNAGIRIWSPSANEKYLALNPASDSRIDSRTGNMAITPEKLDYSVVASLTDGKNTLFTEEKQKQACETIGAKYEGEWLLKGTLTTENKDTGVNVDLSGCTELLIKGYVTGVGYSNLLDSNSNSIIYRLSQNARHFHQYHWVDSMDGYENVSGGNLQTKGVASYVYGNAQGSSVVSGTKISGITKFSFNQPAQVTECTLEIYAR